MAHYAFLDEHNFVTEVIVGNEGGPFDWEKIYSDIKKKPCKQTSYNTRAGIHLQGGTPLRKNYAGIGYYYDSVRDAFIPPQNHKDWILNEEKCIYEPPIPMPSDGKMYNWDTNNKSWVEI